MSSRWDGVGWIVHVRCEGKNKGKDEKPKFGRKRLEEAEEDSARRALQPFELYPKNSREP